MRAVIMNTFGSPDVLHESEVPDAPAPGPGEVTVRIEAVSVNPVDNQVRSGSKGDELTVPLPMILGWDLSGRVEATGPGAERFAVGDPVVGMSAQAGTGLGTWAERVTIGEDLLAPAPRSLGLREAAALPLAALSVYQPFARLPLPPGGTILVTGGVGALGGYALQLARLRGWHAAALVREKDTELARELGAQEVHTSVAQARRSGGYDVVFETAGIPDAIEAVKDGGRLVTVVPTVVPPPERGITPEISFVEQDGRALEALVGLVDSKDLTVRVGTVHPFARAAEAVRAFEDGGIRGKVLLVPTAPDGADRP
ncbi:NADP-dependent oxidoreductase [Streptomyces sp. NPDC060184]|uniref:NADP-dependent oxidoreductase n=1 Tax=Streptomyces sp. NPDC060184 TaxID=3347064 RepID=UPI00365279A0